MIFVYIANLFMWWVILVMKIKEKFSLVLPLFIVLLICISIFAILDFFMHLLNKPRGILISNWNHTIPFYERIDNPGKLELAGHFRIDENNLKKDLAIVFQKAIVNRLEIYVNDKFINAFGDAKSGNLWPSAIVQELPKEVLKEENTLKLVIYGTVGYGISYNPYITDANKARKIAYWITLLRNNIALIAMGSAIVIVYILLFSYSLLDFADKKLYLNIGYSIFFTILSLIQFIYRETSGSQFMYLILEKLSTISPLFGITFIYFGLNSLVKREIKLFWKNVLIFTPILLTIPIFSFNRISMYNNLVSLVELYSFLMVFLTLFLIVRYQMKEYYFPILFLTTTALQTLYVLVNQLPGELMIVYGRIVFSIYIGTLTIKKFKNISEIKRILEQENLIDKLTGAYNRKIIEYIKPEGILVILDLDNFKEVNDIYGHIHGDKILKRFADIVKQNIRSGEDYFIRLGGDEFCIITNSVDVKGMMERIYNASRNELGLGFSYGFAPFKDFDEAYAQADEVMYEMKERRRREKL